MKTLLFAVSSATSYRLHSRFARYCAARGHGVHLVYDAPPDALFDQLTQDAHSWGGTAVSLDASVTDAAEPDLQFGRMPHPLRARAFAKLVPAASSIHRRLLGARMAAAQALLHGLKPAAVVVAEDGISGPAAIMAAARNLGVPVADLPYGYGTRDDFDNALDEKAATEPLNRPGTDRPAQALRWLAPQWVKRGKHAGVILFPQDYILAREALGMTLRDAWTVHGGHADRLFAESRQMLALYRGEGVPERKLVLTGTPYCDLMAEALAADPQAQAAFRKPRTVEPGKLRILVSWPTSYHATRGAHCEFPSYEEMTRTVLGWLAGLPGCEVTVSLHPAIPPEARGAIEALGLRISTDYVIGLIPRHDIYVSYFSSTQRWALACGKPVVNYDAYGVDLDVYDAAPGFIKARKFEEFQARVLRLTDLEAGFAPAAAAQSAVAEEWGTVDGRASERILAELLALAH
jgi:hypothetical protein